MAELTKLVRKWLDEPSTYDPKVMRECLDSWRGVLFNHLDQEVRGYDRDLLLCSDGKVFLDTLVLMIITRVIQVEDLRGENMKKYFTLEELEEVPI